MVQNIHFEPPYACRNSGPLMVVPRGYFGMSFSKLRPIRENCCRIFNSLPDGWQLWRNGFVLLLPDAPHK
jgi:hypothetical protein